jgi:cytochrome c
VGGTNAEDIERGRVAALSDNSEPQRTTLMKLSTLSTLWDYTRRAMPWNEPKSLSVDEVYAVVAYLLHLGDIVPADFELSDRNIAQVQRRLPNRDGMVLHPGLWRVDGEPDVQGDACTTGCAAEVSIGSSLPGFARDAHGNLARQNRLVGPVRGVDTTRPPAATLAQARELHAARATGAPASTDANAGDGSAAALAVAHGCRACHAPDRALVGPAWRDVAARYAGRADAAAVLAARVEAGSSGEWGATPMPAHPAVPADDVAAIVGWILDGAR